MVKRMWFEDVTEAVGNTPTVRLNKLSRHTQSTLFAKLEYLNPGGSVKDRVAVQIVEDAEAAGLLKPGGTIVEATSGNTGMGLAMAAAVRGYKCIFVMPDKMSIEKVQSLRAVGARVVITPTAVEPEDPRSYYSVSRRIADETPGAFYANQYHNPSNPRAHYLKTGPELWEQMDGKIDVFVCAMGTGGTISGTAKYLKEQNPSIKVVGIDPVGSIYYDYFKTGKLTEAHTYKVEGFGEDFLPSTMNFEVIDDVIRVSDAECFEATRRLVREEGIYTGGSGGGTVAGALRYAEQLDGPANIVMLMPDSATRYLTKIFDDDWMREHGFFESAFTQGTVGDLLDRRGRRELVSAKTSDTVRDVVAVMKARGFSQLPVLEGERLVGTLNESDVLNHLLDDGGQASETIEDLVETSFAVVEARNRVSLIGQFIKQGKVVFVMEAERLIGIITKIDYIDYISGLS